MHLPSRHRRAHVAEGGWVAQYRDAGGGSTPKRISIHHHRPKWNPGFPRISYNIRHVEIFRAVVVYKIGVLKGTQNIYTTTARSCFCYRNILARWRSIYDFPARWWCIYLAPVKSQKGVW